MKRQLLTITATLCFASAPAFAQDEETGSVEASGEVSGSAEVSTTGSESATTASASSVESKLGLGSQLTLTGAVGLSVIFHLQDKIFIQGLIGFVNVSPEEGDGATAFTIGAGGFYKLFEKGPADLYIGGRLTFSDDGQTNGASATGVEVPLQVRLNVHPNLAFNLETGLGMALVSQGDFDRTEIFLGRGDLYGLAGFTIYL